MTFGSLGVIDAKGGSVSGTVTMGAMSMPTSGMLSPGDYTATFTVLGESQPQPEFQRVFIPLVKR